MQYGSLSNLTLFAGLVIDLKQAFVLVDFLHFLNNAFKLLRLRQLVDWMLMFSMGY